MRVGMGEFSIFRVQDEYWPIYSASVAVSAHVGPKSLLPDSDRSIIRILLVLPI